MAGALELHDSILSSRIATGRGRILKTTSVRIPPRWERRAQGPQFVIQSGQDEPDLKAATRLLT